MINKNPTTWQRFRETLGRALRETGQALDRIGLRLESFTWLPNKYVGGDPPVRFQDFLSRHRQQMPLLHCGRPVVSRDVAFLAPCATLIGSVRVQKGASIWYGAMLRADQCWNADSFAYSDEQILQRERNLRLTAEDTENEEEEGTAGKNGEEEEVVEDPKRVHDTSHDKGGGIYIGENSNIQDGVSITARSGDTVVGQGVTVGHLAQLHSCRVEDFSLIGMGSVIGENVTVQRESLVAAGAVVPPNTVVGEGELWVGQPARKIRDLRPEERQKLHYQSSEYVKVAATHQHVMELGGNLGEEHVKNGPAKALQLVMEHEAAVAGEPESDEERMIRMNKWRHSVYRQYVTPPELQTKLDNYDAQQERLKLEELHLQLQQQQQQQVRQQQQQPQQRLPLPEHQQRQESVFQRIATSNDEHDGNEQQQAPQKQTDDDDQLEVEPSAGASETKKAASASSS